MGVFDPVAPQIPVALSVVYLFSNTLIVFMPQTPKTFGTGSNYFWICPENLVNIVSQTNEGNYIIFVSIGANFTNTRSHMWPRDMLFRFSCQKVKVVTLTFDHNITIDCSPSSSI